MNQIRDELDKAQLKMLGIANGLLDKLAPSPAAPNAVDTVARRQIANILRVPSVCARSTCRRTGGCRGEPSQCLRYALPLLPPEVLAGLLAARGRRSRRRRSA
jgi:hypothetical protein